MSKIIFTIFSLIFITILMASVSIEANGDEEQLSDGEYPIRIMTFNIRFDNPDDGPDAWPYRKDFVASMFRFHQNDIVGTQEGMHHQLVELDKMLPEFEWVGVGRDAGDERGEFCAIYYRPDRFELIEEDTFWLSETPEVPGSMGWDTAITRITTWARFYDKKNDRRLIVFNTHYDHRGEVARVESSKLILQKIKELANGDPVVFIGDLNTTENDEPYKIITKPDPESAEPNLFDGFYHSVHGHHGPTSTWNAFERIFPDRRIDYIFVDSNLTVKQHGVLADIRDGHFPSDHLPVVADIVFKD